MRTSTEEETARPAVPTGLFINGAWRDSSSGRSFKVADPALGLPFCDVADGDVLDGHLALDAAVAAQDMWQGSAPRVRGELLRGAFDEVRRRRTEFAALITREMGKPMAEAQDEVDYATEFLRWFSEESVRVHGRYSTSPEATAQFHVARRAVGPCLLITPWNFPLAMATRKIAPAIAAGCTMVLKPADLTPLTTNLLVTVFEDVGLPPGVLNVVQTTRAPELVGPLLADPRLRKLSFTGSTQVGRWLLGRGSETVLRTSMELGGNAPFVVLADADLDRAVAGAMAAKMRNAGQACTAANRFLVHETVAPEFSRMLAERMGSLAVGPGADPRSDVGPIIDERSRARIWALVADAVEAGAEVLTGGRALAGPGYFMEPTVLHGVPVDAPIVQEEIFGPVAAITTFATELEAVRLANSSNLGLAAYLFTRDEGRGMRIAEQLEVGMVGVNTGAISNVAAPFGGVKQSGIGREGGAEGLSEYLESQHIALARAPFVRDSA